MRILFSDEKMFAFDGIYNSQNDGIWAINREEKIGEVEKNSKERLQKK